MSAGQATTNVTAEFEAVLDAAIAAVRVDHRVKLDEALEDALDRLDNLPELSTAIYDALYRHALRAALAHRLSQPRSS